MAVTGVGSGLPLLFSLVLVAFFNFRWGWEGSLRTILSAVEGKFSGGERKSRDSFTSSGQQKSCNPL